MYITNDNFVITYMCNCCHALRSGAGSLYGTFTKSTASFSPLSKAQPPYMSERKNFSTSPPKKGTGYG